MGLLQKCLGFVMDLIYTFSRAVKLVWFGLWMWIPTFEVFSVSLWCVCMCVYMYLWVDVQQQEAAQLEIPELSSYQGLQAALDLSVLDSLYVTDIRL